MIFDAYLPATPEFDNIDFGKGDNIKLPVLMYLHGIGMDRGAGNANWTSQYFANLGYLVLDMSYGFTGWADFPYTGVKERGYDYVDTILQLAYFTQYLEQNADYFHADITSVFIAGRSFGGWMALSLGQLANTEYAGGNYSSNINIKGIIPYYPASDIPSAGSELFGLGQSLDLIDSAYIRGSSVEGDEDYNPDWYWYNPLWVAENLPKGQHPDVFTIQGTHDYLVPQGAALRLDASLKKGDHNSILGLYPYGSHGFDALHWSHYGQSITYYMGYFLALNK
jgi:acetyl esterase/lipase